MAKVAKVRKPVNRLVESNGTDKVQKVVMQIQPLRIKRVTFELHGISPLVTHPFGVKARKQMLEKQMGDSKTTKLPPRCPTQEYLDSFYWVKGCAPEPDRVADGIMHYDAKQVAKALKEATFGIPSTAFKNAIVAACRNQDVKMTKMKQACFVRGANDPNWAVIDGVPELYATICRIGKKTPYEVFRPMWREWSTMIEVEWDMNVMNENQIANLLEVAGYYVGVCEGRPEKSSLGWGRWEICKGQK